MLDFNNYDIENNLKKFINIVLGRETIKKPEIDFSTATTRGDLSSDAYSPQTNPYIPRNVLKEHVFQNILQIHEQNETQKRLVIRAPMGLGKTRFIMELIREHNNKPFPSNIIVGNHRIEKKLKFIYYFFEISTETSSNDSNIGRILTHFIDAISDQLKQNLGIANIKPKEYYMNAEKNMEYQPSEIKILTFLNEVKRLLENYAERTRSHIILCFDGLNELLYSGNEILIKFTKLLLCDFELSQTQNITLILTSQPHLFIDNIKKNYKNAFTLLDADPLQKYPQQQFPKNKEKLIKENKDVIRNFIRTKIIPELNISQQKESDEKNIKLEKIIAEITEQSHNIMAYAIGLLYLIQYDPKFKSDIENLKNIPNGLKMLYDKYILILEHNEPAKKLISAIYYMLEQNLIPFDRKDLLRFAGLGESKVRIKNLPFNFIMEKKEHLLASKQDSKYKTFTLNYHFREYLQDQIEELEQNEKDAQPNPMENDDDLLEWNEEGKEQISTPLRRKYEILKYIKTQGQYIIKFLLNSLNEKDRNNLIKLVNGENEDQVRNILNNIKFIPNGILKNLSLYLFRLGKKIVLFVRDHKIIALLINNIDIINPDVLKFLDLQILIFNECNLKNLPENIDNLHNLFYLNISNSQLSSLPESIGKLINLKEL
ncbi:MAG: hypothetical protein ACTSQJ_19390, partial [Promethearchaeota archaeon]